MLEGESDKFYARSFFAGVFYASGGRGGFTVLFLSAAIGGKSDVAAASAPFVLIFSAIFFVALAIAYAVWQKKRAESVGSFYSVAFGLIVGYAVGIIALFVYLFAMPMTAIDSYQAVIKQMLQQASGFILYLSIAVAAVLLIALIAVYYANKNAFPAALRISVGCAVGYALAVVALFTYLNVWRSVLKDELTVSFWLMIGFFAALVVLGLVGLILKSRAPKAYRVYRIVAVCLLVVYAILMCCLMPAEGEDYEPLSAPGMYISSVALVAVIALTAWLYGKDRGTASQTKQIAYAGVCISLSFALSYVKFFSLPQGGSVTFASLLPLMLYAYMFGARKGVFAGVIYGLLQFIQSPQFYQPMQVLLDYPIAFGAIGLTGFARTLHLAEKPSLGRFGVALEFSIGATFAVLFRYLAHFLSGYFVFSSWRMEGYTALTWSLVYNLFTIADLAIVLVAGIAFLLPKAVSRMVLNVNPFPPEEEI